MDELPFAFTVSAPAKLNLGLEVLGRRADGYHDLATVFLTVSLCDELSVAATPGPRIGLECSGSDVPPQENLVWRAAEAMQQVAPGHGVLLKLEKRIPIAAGLGGASSDAAATLLARRGHWQGAGADGTLGGVGAGGGASTTSASRGAGVSLSRRALTPSPSPDARERGDGPSPQPLALCAGRGARGGGGGCGSGTRQPG